MLSYESTWMDVAAAKPKGAVIGIGAIEQHGPHLPLNVDCLSADDLARGIAEAMDWLLLPTMPYGCSSEHMDFPGTITLRSETLVSFFKDLAASLQHHGITQLAVVSGHGGNWFLKMMAREMNFQNGKMRVFVINTDKWFYPVVQEMTSDKTLHHAGEHETALVMHLRPDLVKGAIPVDDNPDFDFDMLDLVQSRALAKSGHWGFPSKATPEKGRLFLERSLAVALKYLRSRLQLVEMLNGKRNEMEQR